MISRVEQCIHDTYGQFPKKGKPNDPREWTICSAIVQEWTAEGEGASSVQTVALATGCKAVPESLLHADGTALCDSHAEVLCRRAFRRYLYRQMELALDGSESCLVLDAEQSLFALRHGVRFHFYCSQTPCGDCSIFPLSAEDINRTGSKPINGEQGDPLLPGADYHTCGQLRGKPGRGEKSLSVSCSDKLMRANVLGWQGALLSRLLADPVHIHSWIVGDLFNRAAIQRGVLDRFQDLSPASNDSFPPMNRLISFHQATKPFLHAKTTLSPKTTSSTSTSSSSTTTSVTSSSSSASSMNWISCGTCILWSRGQEKPDAILGKTGLPMGTTAKHLKKRKRLEQDVQPTPCSKRDLFLMFSSVMKKLAAAAAAGSSPGTSSALASYQTEKLHAGPYQQLKRLFIDRICPNWPQTSTLIDNWDQFTI